MSDEIAMIVAFFVGLFMFFIMNFYYIFVYPAFSFVSLIFAVIFLSGFYAIAKLVVDFIEKVIDGSEKSSEKIK